ncbi:MAG: hypothetical protein HY814_01500 [Candidatus Riflebacteria bacterium]|nr:hypothetical protein [Candidatus Riflebacteria bacterium]
MVRSEDVGGWLELWERLVADPVEETDALEFVLARLRRGATLPESLTHASRLMQALGEPRGPRSPAARLSRLLASMASEPAPGDGCPEPWRTLLAAWTAFASGPAIAEYGPGLVTKLRARRALRVEVASLALYTVLSMSLLVGGCLAVAAWRLWAVPEMALTLEPGSLRLVTDWTAAVACPLGFLLLAVLGELLFLGWIRDRLVSRVLGENGSELLFFVGVGIASGAPLPAVLRRAASGTVVLAPGDSRFLASLADSMESGTGRPAVHSEATAHRSLVQAALLLQGGLLTTESLQLSAGTLVDRFRARRGWKLWTACVVATAWFILTGVPVFVALLGGPTGSFWSGRIQPALRMVPPVASTER